MRTSKRSLAIGWGEAKALPLVVSLRIGIANALIVDEKGALAMLREADRLRD